MENYKPNILLMSDLHRRIVTASKQFTDYVFLLRPTRRHIFIRQYKIDQKNPDFFRPCFGIFAKHDDPDKKPCMVIETEDISNEMEELYEMHSILWVKITQENNCFTLTCNHGGTVLKIVEVTGNLYKMLSAPLSWYERNISFPQGSYVHSHTERVLRDSIKVLSPSYRIECHHQIPLSYVLGVKNDLTPDERKLLGSEIDVVIIQSMEADPDGAVILPIKIDAYDSHRNNDITIKKDRQIRELCNKYHVPLLTVKPLETGNASEVQYEFECPVLGFQTTIATGQDVNSWAYAIAPILARAIRYAGRGF